MGTSLSGKDSYSLSLRITPSCGRTVAPTRRVVSYRHDRGVPYSKGKKSNALALFPRAIPIGLAQELMQSAPASHYFGHQSSPSFGDSAWIIAVRRRSGALLQLAFASSSRLRAAAPTGSVRMSSHFG